MKKKVALALAVFSGVYLFIPEPTDLIPIVGWLDEGLALVVLGWSLKTLGVTPMSMVRRMRTARANQLADNTITGELVG